MSGVIADILIKNKNDPLKVFPHLRSKPCKVQQTTNAHWLLLKWHAVIFSKLEMNLRIKVTLQKIFDAKSCLKFQL